MQMMNNLFLPYLGTLIFVILPSLCHSHPIPDLPVFGSFDSNGSSAILVEVDPRAFATDPETEDFLVTEIFNELNKSARNHLLKKASQLIEESLLVRINQGGWFLPEFKYQFSERSNEAVESKVIFIDAHANLNRDYNSTYQIKAKDSSWLDLIFTNRINGIPHRRVNVLFPGEESFALQLPALNSATLTRDPILITHSSGNHAASDIRSTFVSFLRQGFLHVVPLGVDHILFVVGLFLMSRKFKVLIYQVSVFTLAHTLTLACATLGWVSIPGSIVEPIISASIAFIALENIFFPGYKYRRLFIVFFFGLIHGLGFAGALSDLQLDSAVLIISLIGFNIGVEGGQLTVIALCLLCVYQIKDSKSYRKWVIIPGSLVIAGFGVFWTLGRIFY